MRPIVVLLAMLICMPLLAGSGNAWRNARWGMSLKQVLRSFPNEAVPLTETVAYDNGKALARIHPYRISDATYRVDFVFGAEGKLVMIALYADDDAGTAHACERIANLLTEKYGKALRDETTDNSVATSRTLMWKASRDTVVDVFYYQVKSLGGPLLQITYHPPAGESGDKL